MSRATKRPCDACARPVHPLAACTLAEFYRAPGLVSVCPACADATGRLVARLARRRVPPGTMHAAGHACLRRIQRSWRTRFRRWRQRTG